MKHKTEIAGPTETLQARASRDARDVRRGDIAGATASAVTLGLLAMIVFAAMTSSTEFDTAGFIRILSRGRSRFRV